MRRLSADDYHRGLRAHRGKTLPGGLGERGGTRALLSLALVAVLLSRTPHAGLVAQQVTAGRLTVIVSDFHFGLGRDPVSGEWHALEDFRWGDALRSFLRAVDEAGKGATDLVLNGDTFELWQSLVPDCRTANVRAGCTGEEALGRLERVLQAHAAEVADLGAFARAGTNRIVIVPGDHDAAILFPAVAERLLSAFSAPMRVTVSARGYWLSGDGAIYAEHGHQIAGDPYRFGAWPEPFIQEGGRAHLERTWAEQLIQGIYNEYESRYPILDNVAMDGVGLKYLAAADPATAGAAIVGPMVRFFLSNPAWQQFRLDLDGGDVEAPEWDVALVRRAGPAFLVESLLADDRLRGPADRALKENQFTFALGDVSDQEIVAICDYRAALRRARRRLERSLTQSPHVGPPPAECPRVPTTRGSGFEYYWRSRDARFTAHLDEVRRALARDAPAPSIKVFVYGHIHLPSAGFVVSRGAEWPIVLNSGAWQRTVTPFQLDELMKDRGWTEVELLRQLQPEQLPACYGLVWIDPYADRPQPRFRYWRGDGKWGNLPRDASGIATACGGGGGPAA